MENIGHPANIGNSFPANSTVFGHDAERRLGRTIRALREARGWSQTQLAQALNDVSEQRYTQSMIAKTEAGERPIRLNEAVNLAFLFSESLELLLAMEQEPELAAEIHRLEEGLVELEDKLEDLEEKRARLYGELEYARSQAQLAAIMRDQGRNFESLAKDRDQWLEQRGKSQGAKKGKAK